MIRRVAAMTIIVMTAGCSAPPSTKPRLPAAVPESWQSLAPPDAESEAALCANVADTSWSVSLTPDSTAVQASPAVWRHSDTLDLPGGQLIAADWGEFGGEVSWQPAGRPGTVIAHENVRFLVPMQSGVYGLAGLAHLGTDEGRLLRFGRSGDDSWTVDTVMELGSAPAAFTQLGPDSLLVAAPKGLLVVHVAHGVHMLAARPTWWLTYPSSVVQDRAGVVYVGMRLAVAQLTPDSGYAERWLVPAGCAIRERSPDQLIGCRCVVR
jgi:hypothetical protein